MAKPSSVPRVAIVTDWLPIYGGAEKVVKAVHELFPEAPIYTSQYSAREVDWFRDCDVRTGWVNWFPARLRKLLSLPRAWYFARLDLSAYQVVISITTAESKGVKTRPDQLHISYLQGPPTQYFWGMYDDYVKNPGFGRFNGIVRLFFKLLVGPLRRIDYRYAQRPDYLLANSSYSAQETQRYYHRPATVVFPPVAVDKFQPTDDQGDFLISTSRQVNWKRLDLAIKACMRTGDRLKLVGTGAEHQLLQQLAAGHPNIEFIPTIQDPAELARLVAQARGFVFPSQEPFGIAPIEALSAGVPVVAYQKGGALDYIEDGVNGLFFAEQTVDSLEQALRRLPQLSVDKQLISDSAKRFSEAAFQQAFGQFVEQKVDEKMAG